MRWQLSMFGRGEREEVIGLSYIFGRVKKQVRISWVKDGWKDPVINICSSFMVDSCFSRPAPDTAGYS